MDIDSMKAGPVLNILIAEEVMEWHPPESKAWMEGVAKHTSKGPDFLLIARANNWWLRGKNFGMIDDWHPSTDWSAAGEVLQRLVSMGHKPVVGWNGSAWDATSHIDIAAPNSNEWVSAETGPLAICLAALKAV